MYDAGRLSLRIEWDGNTVRGTGVESTRPQAYRIFKGKRPENAVQLVPLLFNVCGKAQQAASTMAVAAAQNHDVPRARLEMGVACEAMQEHLWRLLLDWPNLLGLPLSQQQFVRWHGMLKAIANGQGNAEGLLSELRETLLGVTDEEWKRLDSHAELGEWWKMGQGLLAPVIAALDLKEGRHDSVTERAACALMPQWTAAEMSHIYSGHIDPAFAAMPQHDGQPMETGELAHRQNMPLVQDVLRQRPARLLARVVARLVDLLESAEAIAQGNVDGRVQGIIAADGVGISTVRTARGNLVHEVRMEPGRIAEYFIVAPTEWNFHPQGALASGLIGMQENDAGRLAETAKLHVLSLDPCVEYDIEVVHA